MAWSYMGYFLARAGRYYEALDAYVQAIALNANAPRIWYNYGTVFRTVGIL